MIRLDFEQGSYEWKMARLGIATASRFKDILTPSTRKYSKASEGYRNELLAEWVLGYPLDEPGNTYWMDRGTELEPAAVRFYEFETDADVETVGIVLRDDRMCGASPDGFVGEDGGIEIKCRAPKAHIASLLSDEPPADMTQVQGNLWLCERDWWDVVAYHDHPDMPNRVWRIPRDEEYIADLAKAMDQFVTELLEGRESLKALGVEDKDHLAAHLPEQAA